MRIFSFGIVVFFLSACAGKVDNLKVTPDLADEGKLLMEKHCNSCHNTQNSDVMLAPPMFRVRDHYLTDGVSKKAFTEAIVAWVNNPTEENAKMPGALRKFGLMPKQSFEESEVRAIAEYLYSDAQDHAHCNH